MVFDIPWFLKNGNCSRNVPGMIAKCREHGKKQAFKKIRTHHKAFGFCQIHKKLCFVVFVISEKIKMIQKNIKNHVDV